MSEPFQFPKKKHTLRERLDDVLLAILIFPFLYGILFDFKPPWGRKKKG